MSGWRQFLGDVLGAAGVGIALFASVLIVIFVVGLAPAGNPYVGAFVIVLLPLLIIIGGLIFGLGALLGRGGDEGREDD